MIEPVVLGSRSPRRRELLAMVGIEFEVSVADVEEDDLVGDDLATSVVRTARAKFEALSPRIVNRCLVTADTLVGGAGRVLGKPRDRDEAAHTLGSLAATTVEVASALCVGVTAEPGDYEVAVVTTTVALGPIAAHERTGYVDSGVWQDKAGGLELQGAGRPFIRSLEGCWSNVVGLPVCETARLLAPHAHRLAGLRGQPWNPDHQLMSCPGPTCGFDVGASQDHRLGPGS